MSLGVCACTCMCVRACTGSCLQSPHLYLLYNHFVQCSSDSSHGGSRISLLIRSHSCVVCWADFYTPRTVLHFTVGPCHPHHPFLAAVSLALLSFPPTLPCCATLPLPLLLCFKSSSFPLSIILPIPPLSPSLRSPTFSLPLSEWVAGVSSRCKAVWEVVVMTAWQAAGVCFFFF